MSENKDNLFGKSVISPLAMREAEQEAFSGGVTEDELIARAAAGLSAAVRAHAGKRDPILIVAGGGNNGCDGLECALALFEGGYRGVTVLTVPVVRAGNERRAEKLRRAGAAFVTDIQKGKYKVIADCLLGTGINRAPEGETAALIRGINGSGAFVVSADVPSGLDAETGEAFAPCVSADMTVSFGGVKCGLLLGEGRNYAGEIAVCDIGVNVRSMGAVLAPADVMLPPRRVASHKGNYGKVRVIGGSDEMPGAPLMCYESALAASRGGAGLVTLCVPDCLKAAYQSRVTETMLRFLPSENGFVRFSPADLDGIMDGADTIAIGCGMGRFSALAETIEYLARRFTGTLVMDADALNCLAAHPGITDGHACKLILTPHVVEFSRLAGKPLPFSADDAKRYAVEHDCVVAVKSATTVITDGERTFFNVTGTPALAKGGSGDVLAGLTAATACVLPPFEATAAAVFHFGRCGEAAMRRLNSVTSVLARDVIIEIGYGK